MRPLYERRSKAIAQIPHFWPLVLEQAPPDLDEYIQPLDSSLLLGSLTSLTVTRFEIAEGNVVGTAGDPRSLAIRFEFAENEYFENRVLEKRFWHRRRAADGWSGLVSEPVDIRWREGKDLTNGLLGLVKRVWDGERRREREGEAEPTELTAEQRALKERIDGVGLGGLSFFAWFGFRGPNVPIGPDLAGEAEKKEEEEEEGMCRSAGLREQER